MIRWGGLRGLAAVALICATPWTASASGKTAPPEPFPISIGGPFVLVDQDGVTRTDRDFHGRHLLIYFGYTYCPDICPTSLLEMAAALDMLGAARDRLQPVFITVDPARDGPEVLKGYVGHFHPELIGLTGTPEQIRAVARAYRIHRIKVPQEGGPDGDDYLVSHSSVTYLMGPDGAFLTLLPHGSDAARIAEVIRKYIGTRDLTGR